MPTITMEKPITADPISSIGFLPTLSMIIYPTISTCPLAQEVRLTMAGIVLTKNTTPVTPVASIATVTEDKPRLTKTFVA
jgi:hypothetical protein